MIFLNNLFGGAAGSGGDAPIVDYVNGNITVTLPQTEYIHGDNFNTSGAEVIYTAPDGTQTDVTSAASFDPSNGSTLNQDGQVTVRISYTPSGKDTIYATQLIHVEPVPESLTVILHDTGCRVGENISYKGAVVKALMSDRSEKDVSGETLVWSPLEGTTQNSDGTVTVRCTYVENGVSASGTAEMVVTDRKLVRITADLGETQYYYNDSFDTTNTVVTATYDDGSTANVKSKCEFLPENRTKLTTHGPQTVLITYTENAIKKSATAQINVRPIPQEVEIQFEDNGFRTGDTLTYSNAKVIVKWSDGTTSDETKNVEWDPEPNTVLDRDGDKTVKASYVGGGKTTTGQTKIHVTNLVLISIGADFTKKVYNEGDSLDLTGAVVTALYDTGVSKDVTDNARWSPSEGSSLRKGTTKVQCSYTENGVKKTKDIPITVNYVESGSGSSGGSSGGGGGGSGSGQEAEASSGIRIEGLRTVWDAKEPISYEGVHVYAKMSSGDEIDVTDSVTWDPREGNKLDTTDRKVIATYRDDAHNTHKATEAITVNDIPTKLDVDMSVRSYEVGDSLDTSGSQVVLTFASGRTQSLKVSDVTWDPSNGTKLKKEGTQFITVTYTTTSSGGGGEAEYNDGDGGSTDPEDPIDPGIFDGGD